MFCCLTGGKKEQRQSYQELAANPTNKKPEDLIKEPIPLWLSEHINFTFKNTMKWSAQISLPEPTSKIGSSSNLEKKIKQNKDKLLKLMQQELSLQQELEDKQKQESEIYLEIAKAQLRTKTIQYLVASETINIYSYEEKVRVAE